jgi:hypothetical protein
MSGGIESLGLFLASERNAGQELSILRFLTTPFSRALLSRGLLLSFATCVDISRFVRLSDIAMTTEHSVRSSPIGSESSTALEPQEAKTIISAFALPLATFIPRRYKYRNIGSWTGHLAFASDLIAATQPGLIVELGTHWGESYFTFCQTVEQCGLSALCYAVDHWLGDEHAGRYGEEVFEDVRQYNERYYRQFSYLLRTNFDDAAAQFADGSIDLLHIDGLHTYEAVSRDFRTWLPKVSPNGIILLHDICPRHLDFGVWRLWDEIKAEFPDTFEFHHSWGLGVVCKAENANSSLLTDSLFRSSPSVQEEIRRRYVVYASHLENLLGGSPRATASDSSSMVSRDIRVQVFPFGAAGYSQETSLMQRMKAGTWNTLVFELPEGEGRGALRIDPMEEPGFVELGDILISSQSSGDLLWCVPASSGDRNLVADGTAAVLPSETGSLLISFGDDPQLIVSAPTDLVGPLRLTISLRVSPAAMPVPELVQNLISDAYAAAEQRLAAAQEAVAQQVAAARANAEQRVAAARIDQYAVANELKQAIAENKTTQELLLVTEERLRHEQNTRLAMERSLSWRVTGPIRRFMTAWRSGPRK